MQARFSFQLYCARNEPAIEPVLAMVAKHGYKEVEGYSPNFAEPEKMRSMLDAHGLVMPSGHFPIDMLEKKKSDVLFEHVYEAYQGDGSSVFAAAI